MGTPFPIALLSMRMENTTNIQGISLAGVRLNCRFTYPESHHFFRHYYSDIQSSKKPVGLEQDDLLLIKEQYPEDQPSYVSEIKMLSFVLSDALLTEDRFIFHAVAFVYRNSAWLLAAPSGTGKTTQYRNLKKRHPKEITILCGDNPILQFEKDQRILVHHSPWNGKEGYGSRTIAPLAGLILLEQSEINRITVLSSQEAVIPIFCQINTFLKTENTAHKVFRLEEKLLTTIPLWRFQNRGDMESSEMLFQLIGSSYAV